MGAARCARVPPRAPGRGARGGRPWTVTLPQKRKLEEEIIRRAAKTALRQGEVEEDHADKSQRTSEGLPDRYGFNPFESARTFIDWQQRTMYVEVDGQFVPRPLPPGV